MCVQISFFFHLLTFEELVWFFSTWRIGTKLFTNAKNQNQILTKLIAKNRNQILTRMMNRYQTLTYVKMVSNHYMWKNGVKTYTCEELVPILTHVKQLVPKYHRREELVLNPHRCQRLILIRILVVTFVKHCRNLCNVSARVIFLAAKRSQALRVRGFHPTVDFLIWEHHFLSHIFEFFLSLKSFWILGKSSFM